MKFELDTTCITATKTSRGFGVKVQLVAAGDGGSGGGCVVAALATDSSLVRTAAAADLSLPPNVAMGG